MLTAKRKSFSLDPDTVFTKVGSGSETLASGLTSNFLALKEMRKRGFIFVRQSFICDKSN